MGFQTEGTEETEGDYNYTKHLEMNEMREGLMTGELVKGKLRIGEDWRTGKVLLWLQEVQVVVEVAGLDNINRAVNGD